MKNYEKIIAAITIVGFIFAAGAAWSGLQSKITNLEKAQAISLDAQDKIFQFTMDLWKIDPEQRNKWSKLNWKPVLKKTGDTTAFVSWYEIHGMKRILKYEVRTDSTGSYLFVDTIYNHKE